MYKTLVDCHTLALHLHDPDWVVVDCRFTLTDTAVGRSKYQAGHIPGARYAHLDDDLSGPKLPASGRHPLPDATKLAATFGAWGIGPGKQVICYDDSFGAMAGRLWWLLRWMGHDAVALLDGGLPRWQREGHPMATDLPSIKAEQFAPQLRNEMLVDASSVAKAVKDENWLVMDARSEERFNGEMEPLDPVAGHIPGAVNFPFEDNLHVSGRFESPEHLRDLYQGQLRNIKAVHVIQMCGSGVTACHNILAMEHAGLAGAKLYAGSWSEWIRDPSRPVARDD